MAVPPSCMDSGTSLPVSPSACRAVWTSEHPKSIQIGSLRLGRHTPTRDIHASAARHYPTLRVGYHRRDPALLQRQPDGTPQAEYWLGTHPLGPALAGDFTLDQLITSNPAPLGDRVRQAEQ